MLYLNKVLMFVFVGFCTFQIPAFCAMEAARKVDKFCLNPSFYKSLTVGEMEDALKNFRYPILKEDLYAKITNKVDGTMEWVKYRLDVAIHPESAYDPFLLYFTVRQGFLDMTAPNTSVFLRDLYHDYKAFFSLAIVAFANSYSGVLLGHAVVSTKIYNFLMSKLCDQWMKEFKTRFDRLLALYKYEKHSNDEPVNIIQELKDIIIKQLPDNKKAVNDKFLNCLRSPEWIVCTQCGDDYYVQKRSIDFGGPDAALRKQYADNAELVRKTHEESIIKIMEVLEKLQGSTAEKALALAGKTFDQVWQS